MEIVVVGGAVGRTGVLGELGGGLCVKAALDVSPWRVV